MNRSCDRDEGSLSKNILGEGWRCIWNVALHNMLVTGRMIWQRSNLLEDQMTKRKPATSPKHVRKPKLVAKAQRSAPDVVRSSKHGPQATVTRPDRIACRANWRRIKTKCSCRTR